MGKQETFSRVLSLVEEETEIARDQILSGNKREEVVDARSLLIQALYEVGFYPSQIGALTGICPRCVHSFLMNFRGRVAGRKMLGIYYEKVQRKLRVIQEDDPL